MRMTRTSKKYLLSGDHRLITPLTAVIVACVALGVLTVVLTVHFRKTRAFLPSVNSMYRAWNDKDYQKVYDASGLVLVKRPQDGAVLALHGFSAYYLFAEQNDSTISQKYLDDAVVSLRNAWYRVSDGEKPQIAYVLGKAYYQRGYYYADLAMKYLDFAWDAGLKYADIQEFRGLTANLLGDSAKGIAALTDALAVNKSDLLLFTIAKTYLSSGDTDRAKQYFNETIRTTNDELLLLKCHYELGLVFLAGKDTASAQAEFETILQKDPNSADAHYGLGVIYETQGDVIKARSEWRKALKLDPVHAGARLKLNIM